MRGGEPYFREQRREKTRQDSKVFWPKALLFVRAADKRLFALSRDCEIGLFLSERKASLKVDVPKGISFFGQGIPALSFGERLISPKSMAGQNVASRCRRASFARSHPIGLSLLLHD